MKIVISIRKQIENDEPIGALDSLDLKQTFVFDVNGFHDLAKVLQAFETTAISLTADGLERLK